MKNTLFLALQSSLFHYCIMLLLDYGYKDSYPHSAKTNQSTKTIQPKTKTKQTIGGTKNTHAMRYQNTNAGKHLTLVDLWIRRVLILQAITDLSIWIPYFCNHSLCKFLNFQQYPPTIIIIGSCLLL